MAYVSDGGFGDHFQKGSCSFVQIKVNPLGMLHLSAMRFHTESSPLLSILSIHTYHDDTVDFPGRVSQPSAHH